MKEIIDKKKNFIQRIDVEKSFSSINNQKITWTRKSKFSKTYLKVNYNKIEKE